MKRNLRGRVESDQLELRLTALPSKTPRDLEPLAYFKIGRSVGGSSRFGDISIKPPANRNAPRRAPGRKRVVVFDASSQSYLAALFDTMGVEGFFAQSADELIQLVHVHSPHLAFVHVFNAREILSIKADPAIASTPIVILNSIGHHANDIMARVGLIGPNLSVPFVQDEVQRAIDGWGRGPDQPLPEPIPYVAGDPSLIRSADSMARRAFGDRKVLLRCNDDFYKLLLTRMFEGLEPLPDSLKALPGSAGEKFAAEIAARKPRLLIWFADNGYFLRSVGQSLAPLGVRTLVLTPPRHELHPSALGEGENTMPHHLLPMPKAQLMKVIEDLLEQP